MPKFDDLTGKKYGRLVVIGKDMERSEKTKRTYFNCLCECGNECSARSDMLKNGTTKSCGCLKKEQDKINIDRTIHGESHSRLWRIWKHMQNREYGEDYDLKVCDDWLDYELFRSWALSSGYKDNLTIDRIDVYGDYEPNNCRWITRAEQLNNTTRTLWYELDGEIISLMQAYNIVKPTVTYQTVKERYHKGIRDKQRLFSGQHRGKRLS